MSIITPHRSRTESGFTLLEVMVALVIFSIGMLGLAGIQAEGIQSNNTAYLRTIAMQHAYNISDLIRANTDDAGNVDSTFDNVTSSVGSAPTSCIQAATGGAPDCTTSQMAAFDLYHWKKQIQDTLPSGRATIVNNGGVYEITIMWDEDGTGATGENCSGNSATDLKCYKLHIQT